MSFLRNYWRGKPGPGDFYAIRNPCEMVEVARAGHIGGFDGFGPSWHEAYDNRLQILGVRAAENDPTTQAGVLEHLAATAVISTFVCGCTDEVVEMLQYTRHFGSTPSKLVSREVEGAVYALIEQGERASAERFLEVTHSLLTPFVGRQTVATCLAMDRLSLNVRRKLGPASMAVIINIVAAREFLGIPKEG